MSHQLFDRNTPSLAVAITKGIPLRSEGERERGRERDREKISGVCGKDLCHFVSGISRRRRNRQR